MVRKFIIKCLEAIIRWLKRDNMGKCLKGGSLDKFPNKWWVEYNYYLFGRFGFKFDTRLVLTCLLCVFCLFVIFKAEAPTFYEI